MARDVRVVRGVRAEPCSRRPRTERQKSARRGRIQSFSGKARARFLWHLRNVGTLRYALTLTYSGPPPKDDHETKRHLASFQRWLVRKGVGMVWKQEFTRHGRPHFHVVTTEEVDVAEVRARWAMATGCEETPELVEAGPIRDRTALEFYMVKRQCHYANRTPDGYENMGRWWGYAGPGSSPSPLATIEGDERTMARLVRAAKANQAAKQGGRRRRDNGVTSIRLYGGGGEAMAESLGAYADSLSQDLSKTIVQEEKKRIPCSRARGGDARMKTGKPLHKNLPGAVVAQYRRVGDKSYGPYWVRVWRASGRVRKSYVRPHELAEIRTQCAAYRASRVFLAASRKEVRQVRSDLTTLSRLLRRVEGEPLSTDAVPRSSMAVGGSR